MSGSLGLSDNLVSYLRAHNGPEHPVPTQCRAEAESAHTTLQISAEQGAFMAFLVRMLRAKRAIEVGVYTGYSSIVVALALQDRHGPDAHLLALDISKPWTDKARGYWRAAGVDGVIALELGDAVASLDAHLAAGEAGSFDFAFIDADKGGYPTYYERCLALLRPGGLMVFDNMLWNGAVADRRVRDVDTTALRAVAGLADEDRRVDRTLIAVGDGLLLCMKR
jgi:caffeoyl-CoA O-methyltransferase